MTTRVSSSTKRALLIGNDTYQEGNNLDCCTKDAEDVGNKLKQIGFDVEVHTNRTHRQMTALINKFQEQIRKGDLVVFFFSGHGVQWKHETYLVPSDNEGFNDDPRMYEQHAVRVQKTLEDIKESEPLAIILLLDCCRVTIKNKPKVEGNPKAVIANSDSTDFMTIKGVAGSLIVYACGPDEETFDRSQNKRNSLFTYHLLQHIAEPDLKVEEMMCRVCDGIYNDSGEELYTHRLSTLRTSKIYFHTRVKDVNANAIMQKPNEEVKTNAVQTYKENKNNLTGTTAVFERNIIK